MLRLGVVGLFSLVVVLSSGCEPTQVSCRASGTWKITDTKSSTTCSCVFHAIPITDSTGSRSPVPREADH